MRDPAADALHCEAVMTWSIGAGCDGEGEVWCCVRRRRNTGRWKRRAAGLATQRDRAVESDCGDKVAVKDGLLAWKYGTSNVAPGGIGDGNCKIGGDDHGSLHLDQVRYAVVRECPWGIECAGKRWILLGDWVIPQTVR